MGSKNGKPVLRPEDKVALAKSSGHTEEMVQQEFDKFMKEYPDGKLNKASFNKMMSQALPKKEIDKVEKHVFRVYDTNGDGFIDFIEFMVLFHILSDGTPQDVLGKIFRVFDVNSDGTITKKEMQRLVADLFGLIQIQHKDQNQVSKENIADKAFAEMDEDKDGKVTSEEFVKAVLGQEQFSKMLTLEIMNIFIDGSK